MIHQILQKAKSIFTGSSRRVAIGLGVLKLLRAVLSIYSVVLSAQFFGTSLGRDAWVLGGSVITILTQFLFGPINEIFRAKFVHIREEEGDEKALSTAASLISTITIVSLGIIALILLFPEVFARFIAPGFNQEQLQTLSLMLRWLSLLLLINELTNIWNSLLNSYGSFYVPDIYAVGSVVLNVLIILIFAPAVGIFSLVIAGYLNSILLLLALALMLKSKKLSLNWLTLPRWEHVRIYLLFGIPFYMPYILGQVLLVVERNICTLLGVGSVSILDYARKFIEIPTSIIFSVATTVLTPILANLFSNKKKSEFDNETARFIQMLLLGMAPLLVLFIVSPNDLVSLLLARGSFAGEAVFQTSSALFWFGLGVIGVTLYVVSGQAFIAKKEAKTYAFAGALAQIVPIAINLAFYKTWGITTLAASWSIAHIVIGIFLLVKLFTESNVAIYKNFLKTGTALVVLFGSAFFFHNLLLQYTAQLNLAETPMLVILLSVMILFSLITLVILLFVFNLEEKRFITAFFKKQKGYIDSDEILPEKASQTKGADEL